MTTKQISFNLFEMNCVGHISHGLWSHPDNTRHRFNDIDFWTEEAKLLEAGLFDSVFLADVIGTYDGYRGGPETSLRESVQIPNNDPLLVIPAMAAVTKHSLQRSRRRTSLRFRSPVAPRRSTTSRKAGSAGTS
jgi:long-chain alkane monooxygenase